MIIELVDPLRYNFHQKVNWGLYKGRKKEHYIYLLISWHHRNVSDNIKQSILFINSANEVWKQLNKRFMLSNDSRKYKLNRNLFGLKQHKMKINDYFTTLNSLLEETDSMNTLPTIINVAIDVTTFLTTLET